MILTIFHFSCLGFFLFYLFIPQIYRLLWNFSKLCFVYSLNSLIADSLFFAIFSFNIHLFTSSFGCRALGIVVSFILCTPLSSPVFRFKKNVETDKMENSYVFIPLMFSHKIFLSSIFLFFWDNFLFILCFICFCFREA